MTVPSSPQPQAPRTIRLVEGAEFLGRYQSSGAVEAPFLIRRADGVVIEVSPVLYLLASSLAESRHVDEIATSMTAHVGKRISRADIHYLIERKLRPLGVVEDDRRVRPAASARGAGPLPVRAAMIPAGLVMKVATWLRPLFLPAVVVPSLVLLAIVDVWLFVGHGVPAGLDDFFHRPTLLVMALAITVAAAVFHEFGHATASRYGGAVPGAIGAGIYLIWPVFFNDMNDSYRLSRSGRIRADLGGVYFNVLFVLLLAAAYLVTGFEPLAVLIMLHHLLILQQFVPFVRLDGYYLVSDLAGVPDLFRYVRPVLGSLVPWRRTPRALTALRPGPRAVVTAWVMVTVPLLGVALTLLVVRLPHLLATVWASSMRQGDVLAAALRAGAPGPALGSGLQLTLLMVPFAGLAVVLVRAAARKSSSYAGRPDRG